MTKDSQVTTDTQFAFGKENYILIAIGVLIIITGFILMSGGGVSDPNAFYPDGDPTKTPEIFSFRRITLAPVMILFGFGFEFFAIMSDPDSKFIKFLFRKK